MKKDFRLKDIKELISSHEIKTQDELAQLLLEKGHDVTQATISRDVKSLQLMKVPAKSGGLKYSAKVEEELFSMEKLQRKVRDAMTSLEVINYFVLIKTLPGYAHSFGVFLDALEIEGKAGTICGNDTCLIVCRTPETAQSVYRVIDQLR